MKAQSFFEHNGGTYNFVSTSAVGGRKRAIARS